MFWKDLPEVRGGEEPSEAHWNALLDRVVSIQPSSGLGVSHTSLPWGTIPNYDARGGSASYASPIFQPNIGRSGAKWLVKLKRGLIAGVEPTIDGVRISGEKGRVPVLPVGQEHANEDGEIHVYFRLSYSPTWLLERVEPVALAELPTPTPFTAWKLVLILFADGTFWRALHSNMQHLILSATEKGFAQHLFTADK